LLGSDRRTAAKTFENSADGYYDWRTFARQSFFGDSQAGAEPGSRPLPR